MNILFVCSANKMRSKTAEDYFSMKYPEFDFMSAGTNHKTCQKEGTTPLEEWMLDWSDKIYVMEHKHKDIIMNYNGNKNTKKINVLNIKDIYKYYQKELIEILDNTLKF